MLFRGGTDVSRITFTAHSWVKRETPRYRGLISIRPGQRRGHLAAVIAEAFLARVILVVLKKGRKTAVLQEWNRGARRVGQAIVRSRGAQVGRSGRFVIGLMVTKAQCRVHHAQQPLLEANTHGSIFRKLVVKDGGADGTIRVERKAGLFKQLVAHIR